MSVSKDNQQKTESSNLQECRKRPEITQHWCQRIRKVPQLLFILRNWNDTLTVKLRLINMDVWKHHGLPHYGPLFTIPLSEESFKMSWSQVFPLFLCPKDQLIILNATYGHASRDGDTPCGCSHLQPINGSPELSFPKQNAWEGYPRWGPQRSEMLRIILQQIRPRMPRVIRKKNPHLNCADSVVDFPLQIQQIRTLPIPWFLAGKCFSGESGKNREFFLPPD